MRLQIVVLAAVIAGVMPAVSTAQADSCVAGKCHDSVLAANRLHGPVAAEEAGLEGCVACHVPQGAPCTASRGGEYAFKAEGDALCFRCHDRITDEVHVQAKSPCLSCHDPHGSEDDDHLTRSAN